MSSLPAELGALVNEEELDESLKVIAAIQNNDISRSERERLLVRTAVSYLPNCCRIVVYLKFWEGQTLDEIAHDLDIPLGEVRSSYLIALTYLEEVLSPYVLNRDLFMKGHMA
jgi:DNA-directed RNA polymerase specialized sigma24 family protein